jgi:hypothetical protein
MGAALPNANNLKGVVWFLEEEEEEEEGLHGVHRQLRRNEHPKKQKRAARSSAENRLSPKGGPPRESLCV